MFLYNVLVICVRCVCPSARQKPDNLPDEASLQGKLAQPLRSNRLKKSMEWHILV